MLKAAWFAFAWLMVGAARAASPTPLGAPPVGLLPEGIKPTAYRLDLTVDPSKARFAGHTEIDAQLTRPTASIYLHGNGLKVSRVLVTAGNTTLIAHYTQVADNGVARIDFPKRMPAGALTLKFDYTAAFRMEDEGLFHAKVGQEWYAWTQMEPIDARRMFPGFDQPGFKTPFSVTVTAPSSDRVFANAPEASASRRGASTVHRFLPTAPLPTYLIALGVGPFDVVETSMPPNAVRATPLKFRVIATKGQTARMQYAAAQAPKLLDMLETYLGTPYPFAKLDLLASPLEGGAMENAGLIIFEDSLILLNADAPLRQVRDFAETTAHEMAHQWFGDLVTPTWWTDIWLNESFAEWLGKKIAQQWNPELGIGASELAEAFAAMDTDSLGRGRPIRQIITDDRQIAGAFDEITYQKGAQVLAMFESYLGPAPFAQGVRLYLRHYPNGNATALDFFSALGDAAGNPLIVPAMQSFIEQTGVPLVTVERSATGLHLTQARYRPLGVDPAATQTWDIPLCLARADAKTCLLFGARSAEASAPAGTAPLMPNAGGAGYYRFRLDDAGWDGLIAAAASLPGMEALALADSLWADFAAGTGSFERVIAGARALSRNPERLAALELAARLQELADSEMSQDDLPGYRRLMQSLYGAQLAELGSNLRAGAYSSEPLARQSLRQSLLPYVALQGRDPELRTRLSAAAAAYLAGDSLALDPAFRSVALRVAVQEHGVPFMTLLENALIASSDPAFREEASGALGSGDRPELALEALKIAFSSDLHPLETLQIFFAAAHLPATRETAIHFSNENFQRVIDRFPVFTRPIFITSFDGLCTTDDVARIEAYMRPKLHELGGGELELDQAKERIMQCAALKRAKGEQISAALAGAGQAPNWHLTPPPAP
jgi:aminopeptidase N